MDRRESSLTGDEPYFAGVDIGASAAKVVIIDTGKRIVSRAVARSGTDFVAKAEILFTEALEKAGLTRERITRTVATGYGRRNVFFADDTRTEISCHATGCYHYFPQALTVIDIGGQDNKIIKLNRNGQRTNFKMNRKCAAGTGAFLEEMSLRLDIPLSDMNGLAEQADDTIELGSFCTVFTATEVLEKIRAGHPVSNIIRGLYTSIVKRVMEMDTITDQPVLSGGVAEHNPILAMIFKERIGRPVLLPPEPQLMGAVGAAISAQRENAGDVSGKNDM